MNPENEDSFYDFLQSQITDTPLSLNNELSNMGVKFNQSIYTVHRIFYLCLQSYMFFRLQYYF